MAVRKLDKGCGVLTSATVTVRMPLDLIRKLRDKALEASREREGDVSHRTIAREILEEHFRD
jgi:hypothetical protein